MAKKTVAGTPADPTIDFATLELVDGTKLKLAFDFDSIARVEEETGLSLMVGITWTQLTVRQLRALLYASALIAQPDATLASMTKHINVRNQQRICEALVNAWLKSTPEPGEDADPPQPKA
jgi:hypothetical protein